MALYVTSLPRTFRKAVFTGALKEPEQAWRFLEIPNSTQLKGERREDMCCVVQNQNETTWRIIPGSK